MGSRIFKQQTLQRVAHDKTLDGDGTPQAPLGVASGAFLTDTPGAVDLANLATDVYQSAVVELGGDFTAGEEVKCVRIGDQVTITGLGSNLAHSSSDTPTSSAGAIPAAFRPTQNMDNSYRQIATTFCDVRVGSDGTLSIRYRDSGGSGVARTNTGSPPVIPYNIT